MANNDEYYDKQIKINGNDMQCFSTSSIVLIYKIDFQMYYMESLN